MTCPCSPVVKTLGRHVQQIVTGSVAGVGSNLSPAASAYQRIISINSYTDDEHGDNPGQEKEGSAVSSINWRLLTPWSAASMLCAAPVWAEVNRLGSRNTQRQSGLSQTVGHVWRGCVRNIWQAVHILLTPPFPHALTHTHTPTNSPSFHGLAKKERKKPASYMLVFALHRWSILWFSPLPMVVTLHRRGWNLAHRSRLIGAWLGCEMSLPTPSFIISLRSWYDLDCVESAVTL